jgi:DNA-binding response OmpR family regulator
MQVEVGGKFHAGLRTRQSAGVAYSPDTLRAHLSPGSWIDMLDQIALLPDPPFLIVTSRLADERFWAEALNRGAYDVLAKPFDRTEVVRVVSLAWLHWKVRHEHPAEVPQAWKAASGM